MNRLISIIVPMYNAQKTIEKCLKSLLTQSYSNIEVIVVNDGSSDNSEKIVLDKVISDNRLRLLNFENEGVSKARNRGIEEAKGYFIVFCDSDDYVSKDYISSLVNEYDESIDLVISNYCYENNEVRTKKKSNLKGKYEICNDQSNFWNYLFDDYYIQGPVCKLYKRSLISKYQIRFDEGMNFGEDFKFNLEYLNLCTSIFICDSSNYFYVANENSITNKFSHVKLDSFYKIYAIYYDFIKRYDLDETVFLVYSNQLIQDFLTQVKQLMQSKELVDHVKKEYFYGLKKFIKSNFNYSEVHIMKDIKRFLVLYMNYYLVWYTLYNILKK